MVYTMKEVICRGAEEWQWKTKEQKIAVTKVGDLRFLTRIFADGSERKAHIFTVREKMQFAVAEVLI